MKKRNLLIIIGIILVSFFSCSIADETLDIKDWTDQTHSNNVSPDYSTVFAQNNVLRFDITIDPSDWQIMCDDMENNYGSFGVGGGQSPGGAGGPGGPGGPPGMNTGTENPVFVPCSFVFNGKEWYKVGVRYKGNSSLRNCWQSGISKLPFKLDFNQFEDDYPDIKNQRFFGFRQLSLSNNFNDKSFLREKVTADVFRDAGIRAPQTTFCRIYIDHGNGPVYFGLYTLVEVIDDTMLSDQFGSKNGNCYKPEGTGATFGYNLFNESYFTKKTNEEINDWSDIIKLFEVLHSDQRNSSPAEWRAKIDQVFNTDYFIKWLAVNTAIQNWDTYGKMTHNYYLYNDPDNNKITWIPWDNNEALNEGKQGGALSISLDEVMTDWPLIRFLLDDPVYKEVYVNYLGNFITNNFSPEKMILKYKDLYDQISPFIIGGNGEISGYTFLNNESEPTAAIEYLNNHVYSRKEIITNYLENN